MGSDRTKSISSCCCVAVTIVVFCIMFWIVWFVVGLVLQVSDTQRRALVDYSAGDKPLPTPTTPALGRSTTLVTEETSSNSISKSPTISSFLGRGEPKRKEAKDVSMSASNANATTSNARSEKSRTGSTERASNLTGSNEELQEDEVYARRVLPPGPENRPEENVESRDRQKPADSTPDTRHDISPTKVHDVVRESSGSLEYDRPRGETRTQSRDYHDRDEIEPPRSDDIQSSRRSESGFVDREPDFAKEFPQRRVSSSNRGRSEYDDIHDGRRTRVRYDERDRGRDSDDRYTKGDTRVYLDERDRGRDSDDRYTKGDTRVYLDGRDSPPEDEDGIKDRGRNKYTEEKRERGDGDRYDDRYRSIVETSRAGVTVSTRYTDKDLADKPLAVDDRYRIRNDEKHRDYGDGRDRDHDDERYRNREHDMYRNRGDERLRSRNEERYTDRDDIPYRSRDDHRYRSRDEERYRTYDDRDRSYDDRDRSYADRDRSYDYRDRSYDDRDRSRDTDTYRSGDDDTFREEGKYRIKENDRYESSGRERYRSDMANTRDSSSRFKDDKERYLKVDDDKYIDTSIPRIRDTDIKQSASRSNSDLRDGERKTTSPYEYNLKNYETVTDYDIPVRDSSRSHESPPRSSRPSYGHDEENYRKRSRDDGYRTPSRNGNDRSEISPTRTVGSHDDSKYVDNSRSRTRDQDRHYDPEDTIRRTRIQDSRSYVSESSRKYSDDRDRYRTRLPNERTDDSKVNSRREEDLVFDPRSYASEEDESKRNSGRVNGDQIRKQTEDTRRRDRSDESYSHRDQINDEYKYSKIPDYDRDRSRIRDRYDSRDDDRYISREDRPLDLPVRRYADDDEKSRLRDPYLRDTGRENWRNREGLKSSSSARDSERSFPRDEYVESSRRRYDDDLPLVGNSDGRRTFETPRRTESTREHIISSSITGIHSRKPSDMMVREKRFQSSRTGEESIEEQVPPLRPKDVIEAAIRHSDVSVQNSGKVYYPVFDPSLSNLTSPEIIRQGDRRGTTITAKRRR